MEVVGEALLSVSLEVLFNKLASSDLLKFARQEHAQAELKKWEKKLFSIREVLNDAEEKQITKQSVKAWLGDLRDLAYDMEDILDEFSYEALRRKVMAEPDRASTSKVRKFIPTCCTAFTPFDCMRNVKMVPKIREITRRLEEISAQKAELGLEKVVAITKSAWERPITTSLVYEPWVFGRDGDRKIILDMLLRDEPSEANVSLVSIVAMGGMGKTTLARLVYDDAETTRHFNLKAWVCVSDQFDAMRITKTILESIVSHASDLQDFNKIQDRLRDELKGKRFLLVLDDLWNENYSDWDCLRSPFWSGSPGSKIIVTTRSKNVATMMGGDKNFYELKHLCDDDCWSVFEKHAFENRNINEHPDLVLLGREIVKKCGGLPLAAKALGGLLRHEQRENKWKSILTSKIWDLPSEKCDILPALRLSYNHLPSHLKRCFAYCAIFPKDYEFDDKELIRLWIAESLIQESEGHGRQMEDIGDDYFAELFSRSFFQASSNNKSQFVMHDLINDLAKFVAGDICFSLEDNLEIYQQHTISKKTRYSSFVRGQYDICRKFEPFHQMDHLRSLVALPTNPFHFVSNKVLGDLALKLRRLRVLSFSGCQVNEIPNSIGDMKHLRYLNLSKTCIKWLPESISDLYNLQTLILSFCDNLIRLPISIGNLINLRYLDISGTWILQAMPPQIGKLKKLRVLSKFILGKEDGLKIKDLRDMSHLQGEICISKLENVENIRDARNANLNSKHNLEGLTMEWNVALDESHNGIHEMNVLDSLQPHLNLRKLSIVSYDGPEFPRWIRDASFSKMVDLSLTYCRKCTSLPCLGQLPSLKHLSIAGMYGVKTVGAEFYGKTDVSNKPFPSLESLRFAYMSAWEYWEEGCLSMESFQCLQELRIENCPKLITKLPYYLPSLIKLYICGCPQLGFPLPRLPSICGLQVEECNEMVLKSGTDLTSLSQLTICRILGLTRFYEGFMQFLPMLQVLQISDCGELTYLWKNGFGWENLSQLQRLVITSCPQLVSLGEEEAHGLPCNLQYLTIRRCHKLEKLPNEWQNLTCLEELEIYDCPKLVSFPEMGFPSMLRRLSMENCEALKSPLDGMMMMIRNVNNTNTMCLLECLTIDECPSLICFPKGQLPTSLKELSICRCENLKDLPEGIMHHNPITTNHPRFPCFLESLKLIQCPSLTCFPKGQLPSTLKQLQIQGCEKLQSLPEGIMHHQSNNTTTSLQILEINQCPSLTSFPRGKFPSALEQLKIMDCPQLESISEDMFHNNNSLETLVTMRCPKIESLPKCLCNLRDLRIEGCENLVLLPLQLQNLSSLSSLSILDCENIKMPLSQWGLGTLNSLKWLTIGGVFPEATSFSDDDHHHLFLLPKTLTNLSIERFHNLESLSALALQTLTSLDMLFIRECPKLQSFLPSEGLPDTLTQLFIWNCPLLEQRCSEENGEDWPKIVHIPHLSILSSFILQQ